MMWGQCGDDTDDVGMTGTAWKQGGDHGDHRVYGCVGMMWG